MTVTANDLVSAAHRDIHQVSALELSGLARDQYVLIDVREPEEYAAGHLPGAVNLPRGVLEFRIEAHPALACRTSPELADRGRPLVLYCLTGGRSALATESLQRLGFTLVRSLSGGVTAWRQAGYPLTRE